MDEKIIRETLLKGERVTLECKKAQSNVPVDAWKTYSAFANTYGGLILPGVYEDLNLLTIEMKSTQDVTQGDTQNDTQDDTQGTNLDIWIEEQIRSNSTITTEEMAKKSGKGVATIKRHISKLPHIRFVGSGYSGHWEIIE